MKKLICFFVLLCGSLFSEALPPAPMGSFTFVVMPNTLPYTPIPGEDLEDLTQWIVHNQGVQNIAFVSHVGNLVKESAKDQWERANRALSTLDNVVPYAISPGVTDRDNEWKLDLFDTYFPKERYQKAEWYAGNLGTNHNSYQRIDQEGLKLLIMHIESNPTDEILSWAAQVMTTHKEYKTIVVTHNFVGPNIDKKSNPALIGLYTSSGDAPKGHNSPKEMWDKAFRKVANLIMIVSGSNGDVHADHQTLKGDNGNIVHSLVQNYPDGYLRCYRFTPAENTVQVYTYSPILKRFCSGTDLAPLPEQHLFSFKVPLTSTNAQVN